MNETPNELHASLISVLSYDCVQNQRDVCFSAHRKLQAGNCARQRTEWQTDKCPSCDATLIWSSHQCAMLKLSLESCLLPLLAWSHLKWHEAEKYRPTPFFSQAHSLTYPYLYLTYNLGFKFGLEKNIDNFTQKHRMSLHTTGIGAYKSTRTGKKTKHIWYRFNTLLGVTAYCSLNMCNENMRDKILKLNNASQ